MINNYLFTLYNKNNSKKMKIFFLCLTPIFFLAMMISNPVFSEVIDPRLELIENTKDLRYADLKHMDLIY